MPSNGPQLDILEWETASSSVKVLDDDLRSLLDQTAKAIGKLNSRVCRLSLPFGAEILRDGTLAPQLVLPVPKGGEVWPELPLALVVERAAEVFRYVPDPSIGAAASTASLFTHPLALIQAGEFFGVFEAIDRILGRRGPTPPWNMTAGVRTLHLVAALDDNRLREHLKEKFELPVPDNVSLAQHSWTLMQALTPRTSQWRMVCLLFPDVWFTSSSPASRALRTKLLEIGWSQSAALRQEAVRHDDIGAWCAHESRRIEGHLKGFKEQLIIDSATPGLLQLIEGVSSCRAIGLSLSRFEGVAGADAATASRSASSLDAFAPIREAATTLSEALEASKVRRQPLIALPSIAPDQPRYVPFKLPLRRMPLHGGRGWPDYVSQLGELLHIALVKMPSTCPHPGRPEIPLQKLDLIACPPVKDPNRRPSFWRAKLGTRHGTLLPANGDLGQHCNDIGQIGDGIVGGSPFFAACIRVSTEKESSGA